MSSKIKCLDLFCCGGGAGVGYFQAGMDVTGIDTKQQDQYPFKFVKADALLYLEEHGHEYDLIHASPPCQGYSNHVSSSSSKWTPTLGKDEPRLISKVREILHRLGSKYVIENVVGARNELNISLLLCGTMFGLPITRHRLFEMNWSITQPLHPKCHGVAKRYAKENNWEYRDMSVTGKGRHSGTSQRWKTILGITHEMTQSQLAEAIPPAYTKYIGAQFINRLESEPTQYQVSFF